MTDATITAAILATVIALFVSDRLRMDVVALMAVIALALSGVLTPDEALAGFGASVTVLIAALFIVGAGLSRTGVAAAVGGWIAERGGDDPKRLLILMMGAAAGLSAFMSSTGAVAVFIPIALDLAARTGTSPGRFLMPIAFASLIGGMLTLIGTPPNLIVNAALRDAGLAPFGFFAFTPIGLVVFAASAALMLWLGDRLLPQGGPRGTVRRNPDGAALLAAHGLSERIVRLRVEAGGALAGRSLEDADLPDRFGLTPLGVRRKGRPGPALARAVTPLAAGDELVALSAAPGWRAPPELGTRPAEGRLALDGVAADGLGLVEAVVAPDSPLIGRSLAEADLVAAHGLHPLSLLRRGEALDLADAEARLRLGDVLLLAGDWERLRRLAGDPEMLVVLRWPAEFDPDPPARHKAPIAVAVSALMLAALTLQLAPSVVVVLIAALALVLSGCLSMPQAYRAINWQSVVLIGGMLPMATALDKSGALAAIVEWLTAALGETGPLALMAALMALTSALSQVMSNTATTVLIAPIALASAQRIGVDPHPVLLGVAIAASTAFATPVASPVNTLVVGPGGYRFRDFLRMGLPLQAAALALALLLIPLVRPF
jgi:di/tricarboxylate transporter